MWQRLGQRFFQTRRRSLASSSSYTATVSAILHQSWPFSELLCAITLGDHRLSHCATWNGQSWRDGCCAFANMQAPSAAACHCASNLGYVCSQVRLHDGTPVFWLAHCHTVARIVPLILEDFAVTAQYEIQLHSRCEDERFRIGARDGRPVVWTERVKLQHEPVRAKADGDPRDLSWIRPPPSSIGSPFEQRSAIT